MSVIARTFLFLLLGLSLALPTVAGTLPLPLETMPGKAFSDVKAQAAAESTSGPNWGNAPDPSTLPVHQTFTGTVTADATMSKLAIFSDDGSDVYVDGALVWSAKDKGQALPDIPNSLHELPVTLSPGSHSVEIDYSNIIYIVADASKGIPPDIDGCTLFEYGPTTVVNVQTGSWSPDPAAVGQKITSSVTASVTNPYQSPNGHSISQHWSWITSGVYQSVDGSTGSFKTDTGNYGITWTQGSPSTTFAGIFSDAGFYIIKVTATLTYHDDTTNTDVGTYSGSGYIGGSAGDLAASGSNAASASATPLAAGTAKGVPVTPVSVSGLQYKDPTSGNFVTIPASGTIYVLQNTTLTFKAMPNPSQASFPSGQPAWSGTSGASGSGQTTLVPFATVSTSATDYKTVIATSSKASSDTGNTVNVVVVGLALKQVSFSGAGSHTVLNDMDGSSYGAPQWQDNSSPLNGVVTDAGDKNYPLCYTEGTTASVAVSLLPVPAIPSGGTLVTSGQVKIKGVSANSSAPGQPNFNLPATAATVSASGVSLAATPLANAFPAAVADIPNLAIQWNYSNDNGATYQTGGISSHKVYVTLGDPATPNLYQTVLETGCMAAQGKSQTADVVTAVAGAFTGLKVKRASDGTVMQYWGPVASHDPGIFITADLIKNADGRCGAWQNFMIDVLKAQNISSQAILVQDTQPASIPNGLTFDQSDSLLAVYHTIPAQGNPTPAFQFIDHAVVEVPSVASLAPNVYDPSYGKIYSSANSAASQQVWEDSSIDYYLYVYVDSNGNYLSDPNKHTDPKGTRQTVFSNTPPNS